MAFFSLFSPLHIAFSSGREPAGFWTVIQVRVHHHLSPALSLTISLVWVATTNDPDFLRSEGLKQTINDPIHRKEIVALGIAPFLLTRKDDFLLFFVPLLSDILSNPVQNIANLYPDYLTVRVVSLMHYRGMNSVDFL